MRNLEAALPPRIDGVYYLIVTDRFYTSVQLSYQLLQRYAYSVGTIQDDRQGYCNTMVEKNRNRPKSIAHGTTLNAYIIYRQCQKKRGARQDSHAEFLMQLQAQMLELTEDDFDQQVDEVDVVARALPAEHVPRENPDFQIINGQRKRRQRQVKSVGESKVWAYVKNNTLTCHQIWHLQWNNDKDRPRPRCGRDIQNREAGIGAGTRKRRRRVQGGEDEHDAAEGSTNDTAEDDAEESTREGAERIADDTIEDVMADAMGEAAEDATDDTVQDAVEKAVVEAVANAVEEDQQGIAL
ncbi:hypothetical protein PInf_022174 [Phytophthora infestans]|nr:hypothetical protein PInf_022174 [Phytophthora infestans]